MDRAKAIVTNDVSAQNAGYSSCAPYNAVQESHYLLEDKGKAMLMEDTLDQNVQHNSSISLNVVQREPPVLLRSSYEDQHVQKLPVVTHESLTTIDLVDTGQQPITMEPLESASMIEPDLSPTVGAFTVQCAPCVKWRFIPSKEQYELIRQSILEKPFFCSTAASWRPNASCNDPIQISPELHELWAVDRPGIPLPPDGWERLLVIRPQGSSKFADIYYVTPSGRKLRSMPEIKRYLEEHPDYGHAGVKSSQFSFIIPRPLDKEQKNKKQSLTCDEKGSLSLKKRHSRNFSVESYVKKIGVVESSLKGISSKPKLEKLECQKAALGVERDGESQVLQTKDQKPDSLDCKPALEISLPSEELENKTVWNCVNTTNAPGEIVNVFAISTEQHHASSV